MSTFILTHRLLCCLLCQHTMHQILNYMKVICIVQRKPESDYGNITVLTYHDSGFGSAHNLRIEDFNQQAAFEANVVEIHTSPTMIDDIAVVISNSNISSNSYTMDGKLSN